MSQKQALQDAVKTALKAKAKARLVTLRGLLAAIKQEEVDQQKDLTEVEIIGILDKELKKRKSALEQFQSAGRTDLVDQEAFEIEIIKEFLPEPLTDEALDKIINEIVASMDERGPQAIKPAMAKLTPQIKGRADPKIAAAKLRELLTN